MCVCLINGEIKMVMGLNGWAVGWVGEISLVDDGMGWGDEGDWGD